MSRIDWLGLGHLCMGALSAASLFVVALLQLCIPWLAPAEPVLPFALIAGFSAMLGVVFGGLYVATGVGLGARAPWARVAALLLSGMSIGSMPFGTLLGAASLLTLLDEDVALEFR